MSAPHLGQFLNALLARNPLLRQSKHIPANDRSTKDLLPALPGTTGAIDHIADSEDAGAFYAQLTDQVQRAPFSDWDKLLCIALIETLDEDGYLRASDAQVWETFASLAEQIGLNLPDLKTARRKFLEPLRKYVMQLEPLGCASRNLGECLLAQLSAEPQGPVKLLATRIVEQHLVELADLGSHALAQQLQIKPELMSRAVQMIKSLNPRPAGAGSAELTQFIRPEIIVSKQAGNWRVQLRDALLEPVQLLDEQELHQLKSQVELAPSFNQLLSEARAALRAIAQRADTVTKVALAIVQSQQQFIEHGPAALRPLTRRSIAEQLNVHISTVSRACSGKYIQTPRGVFEFAYFFPSGVSASDGEPVSAPAIQNQIKLLIDKENPRRAWSDAQITLALNNQGFRLSRRTVAKYRRTMNIPASHIRHQQSERP